MSDMYYEFKKFIDVMNDAYSEARSQLQDAKFQRDEAYKERNLLIGLLSKFLPAWVAKDPKESPPWDNVVYIITPNGQCSCHIHQRELVNFSHLEGITPLEEYDGHTTQEKYDRLNFIDPSEMKYYLVEVLGCTP